MSTSFINLDGLREVLRDPIVQEILANAKKAGSVGIIARCEIAQEREDLALSLQEAYFNRRAEMVAKYGEPDPADLLAEVGILGREFIELFGQDDPLVPAARAAYRRLRSECAA